MPPNRSLRCLPSNVFVTLENDTWKPSEGLITLLMEEREQYRWPQNKTTRNSQQSIINIESTTSCLLKNLTKSKAQEIALTISEWAGNNQPSHEKIQKASEEALNSILQAITLLITPTQEREGIKKLCKIEGISLVIASKIYRFCSPETGAAIDRHASYFTNSLSNGNSKTTSFIREWSNGRHCYSRLALYTPRKLQENINEYFEYYLPFLRSLAKTLNTEKKTYRCIITNSAQEWRPADIEMAMYSWWAREGAR